MIKLFLFGLRSYIFCLLAEFFVLKWSVRPRVRAF